MITYMLDGGVNAPENPDSFTIDDIPITFSEPVKDGYEFDGWYSDPEFDVPSPTIPEGTFIDQVIYAKWTLETYTITYNLAGGTNGGKPCYLYDARCSYHPRFSLKKWKLFCRLVC